MASRGGEGRRLGYGCGGRRLLNSAFQQTNVQERVFGHPSRKKRRTTLFAPVSKPNGFDTCRARF